jgi:hypothetical protein
MFLLISTLLLTWSASAGRANSLADDDHGGYVPPRMNDLRLNGTILADFDETAGPRWTDDTQCQICFTRQPPGPVTEADPGALNCTHRWSIGREQGGGQMVIHGQSGDRFHVVCTGPKIPKGTVSASFSFLGGKHRYSSREARQEWERMTSPRRKSIGDHVRVLTPYDCQPRGSGFASYGPTWMDGIRTGTSRDGAEGRALCLCGEQNYATTYTREQPNPELPPLMDPVWDPECACPAANTTAVEDLPYDMFFPCNPIGQLAKQLVEFTNCSLVVPERDVHRIGFLHSDLWNSQMGNKRSTWNTLVKHYGDEVATFLMPYTMNLGDPAQWLRARNMTILHKGRMVLAMYVLKRENVHRQTGLELVRSDNLIPYNHAWAATARMATLLLGPPPLVDGYKFNTRRYLMIICHGGRTLAYMHNEGKVHYTKETYLEPYANFNVTANNTERIYAGIITTGYVPASHYNNNRPMRYSALKRRLMRNGTDFSSLEESVHLRLSLIVHAMNFVRSPICSEHCIEDPLSPPLPECLRGAVRFQIYGCDVEPDEEMTGFNSRIHECNIGPDFSPHSEPDRDLKRDVAADFISFVGIGRAHPFSDSSERQRAFGITKIYDSTVFDPAATIAALRRKSGAVQSTTC